MRYPFFIIVYILTVAFPIRILAQGSIPDARVTATPVPGADSGVSATVIPSAVETTTPKPFPTPRPTIPVLTITPAVSNSVIPPEPGKTPQEDWFYKYAKTLFGVGAAAILSYGILKFKKVKNNKKSEDKCGSIRELLEHKKKELKEMIKNWPEAKLKEIANEKITEGLKEDETTKKIVETLENAKEKYNKLKETIDMLQKKYDLCTLELPGKGQKYVMRIVEGSLIDTKFLDKFSPKKLEYLDDEWKYLLGAELSINDIKEVQKIMIKHYQGPEPWYMDGRSVDDPDEVICAFGADDGEGGRIFKFKKDDQKSFQEVKEYALSKGIPEDQIDFLD